MFKINSVIKLALSTIIIAAVSATIAFAIKGGIEQKAEQIFEKRSLLAVMEKRNENLLALGNNYEVVKEKLPLLENSLPDERNFDKFMADLENLAATTGNVQSLNFEPIGNSQPAAGNIKSLRFSINLTGNSGSFAGYLEKLQKLPYFIEISNISAKNSSGIANNNSQMTLAAKIYIK